MNLNPADDAQPLRRCLPSASAIVFATFVVILASVQAGCGPGKPPVKRRPQIAPVTPVEPADDAVVEVRPSQFLNAKSDVPYIGNEACAKCHQGQHESYLATSHSRAMEWVTEREPPEAQFFHEPSNRLYTVARKDGEMVHREELKGGGDEFSVEHRMKYAVGSGNHSRSYLCEVNGFLLESPVTWYASKQAWSMSPGYDFPDHQGFTRMVGVTCLVCHAGQVKGEQQASGENFNRAVVTQMSIGCESCHGPGGHHEKYHREQLHPAGEPDLTIVNLDRLTPLEQDAICAHCHLRGEATVLLRGRRLADYRPGLRIEDFRIDYSFVTDDGPMTVVGHMEQMRSSRCFTESENMSCTTCHDPHQPPPEENRSMFFRQKCAECHMLDDEEAADEDPQRTSCKLPLAERQKTSATNNCVQCHMPRGDTDIPHFAFTHHRIGIHSPGDEDVDDPASKPPRLEPIQDVSHLPPLERDRALGLAYLEVSSKAANEIHANFHKREAVRLLNRVHDAGIKDSVVESALARMAWMEEDRLTALSHADAALRLDPLDVNAMYVLADILYQRNELPRALQICRKLTETRRVIEDWKLLSKIYVAMDQPQNGVAALRRATEITPFREDIWAELADTAHHAHDHKTEQEATDKARVLRNQFLKRQQNE